MTRFWTTYTDTVLINAAWEREIYVPSLLFPKHSWHCIPLNSMDKRIAVSGLTANRVYNWRKRPRANLHTYHLRYIMNKIISKCILSYLPCIIAIFMSVYHLGLQSKSWWGWALPSAHRTGIHSNLSNKSANERQTLKTLLLIPIGTECPHMHGSTQGPVPAAKLGCPTVVF